MSKARFVTSSEPNEGFRFDEGLIKQLTGGDKVTARFLYAEELNIHLNLKYGCPQIISLLFVVLMMVFGDV